VLGLCAICGLAVLARFPRWIRGPDEAYVIVAEDAWAGRLGVANYDDEAMKARSGAMTEGRNRSLLSPTPPSIAVLLLPLARVPADARPIVWLLLNVGALLATGCLLARFISWPTRHPWLACAAAAALLLSEPLAENLARGQVYLLLMPAVAAVLMATATGKSAGASGLAICTAAKLWGGAVWMALLAARAWRLLGAAAIVTAVLLIAALWVAGTQTWSYYIQVVLPNWLTTPMMTVTAYQTIPAMFAHLLRADPQWNPDPLANLPMVALALTIIAGASLLAVTVWQAAKEERRLAAVAASIVLAVMFSPVAEQYHYLLVVPSITIAVERDGLRWDLRTALLTLVLFLLFFPLPFKSRELADVAGGVFAYPRVVAALLLWTLLVIPRLSSSVGRARDDHADNRDRP
jgi:hypothetical protein